MQCGRFQLDLSSVKVMGVLNCTPDSFYDGGRYASCDAAIKQAERLLAEGVDIIDLGAESTRPNAQSISPEEEIKRLTPIVKELLALNCPLSIDTRHAPTMQVMLDLGVDMINDINALEDDGALNILSQFNAGICLMHMRGTPQTMQKHKNYQDVVEEVAQYLEKRVHICAQNGIERSRLCLDIGFGFAKTPEQNMRLIAHLPRFASIGLPLLIGVSRKSTIGHYLNNRAVEGRLHGTVALSLLSVINGAKIVRVHDVGAFKDALKMWEVLQEVSA